MTGNKVFASMVLLPSEEKAQTISIPVSTPQQDCDLQQIVIFNENIVESWQNRYSGSIYLHKIDLQLAGS